VGGSGTSVLQRVTRATLVVSTMVVAGVAPSGAATHRDSALSCGPTSLVVTWRGTTGGLAGHFGDLFWIRNVGAASCVVHGYPTISFYAHGARRSMTNVTAAHTYVMGVAPGRAIPTVRLAAHGGLGSFWVFGGDIESRCVNATELDVSLRPLDGRAAIRVPRGFETWPYCGDAVTVNPIVPGASGSLPPRPLKSEIMS